MADKISKVSKTKKAITKRPSKSQRIHTAAVEAISPRCWHHSPLTIIFPLHNTVVPKKQSVFR